MREQSRHEQCSRKTGLGKVGNGPGLGQGRAPSAPFGWVLSLSPHRSLFPALFRLSACTQNHPSSFLSLAVLYLSLTRPVTCRLVECCRGQGFDSPTLVFRSCKRRVFKQIGTEMC